MIRHFIKTVAVIVLFFALIVQGCKGDGGKTKTATQDTANAKINKLKLPEGFHAEHLYSPSENKNGSWVSMTFDDKGRLIASDQYGAMYRLQLPGIGEKDLHAKVKVERLHFDLNKAEGADTSKAKIEMGYAQGLVWAFNSLYVMVNHKGDSLFEKKSGFYRLQDTNNDDQFDKITLLKSFTGYEEHGPHSVILAPDKKSLYVVAGNNTGFSGMDAYRLPPVWQRDNLIPDSAHLDGGTDPAAGFVAKVDSSGKHWELFAAGLRNPFDITFNEAGDLFTYDSDMEWDIGMAWYRPTRICHIPSGAEFGWRPDNAKWSPEFLDNLPPLINIGQGSPTNIISGHNANFPEKYRKALLAFDWSFGIIYAVHLQPNGSSYNAKAEEFISGAPLPLTDGVIGPDGALYFLTGGRRIQSDLYRVYYGNNSKQPELAAPVISEETKLRRQLEQFHGAPNVAALEQAWPQLKNEDRFIRYAARIAVEHQPVAQWQQKALSEGDPVIRINALVALARHGNKTLKNDILKSLTGIRYNELSPSQQLDLLRVFEVVLYRMGKPEATQREALISYLDPLYPATTNIANRQLVKLLVYIDAPQVVQKTIPLLETAKDDTTEQSTVSQSADLIFRNPQYGMDLADVLTNTPPAQQVYYALVLSEAKNGWTPELREKYFRWYYGAYKYKGGRQFLSYLDKARQIALKYVPKDQFKHYDTISLNTASLNAATDWVKIMADGGPGRVWKVEEALSFVQDKSTPRNFEEGKMLFAASACINCHSIRGEGGSLGPDLTQLGTRFSEKDILESIIQPNKVISDQYAATVFVLKDGNTVIGRLSREDDTRYYVSQNPFAPQTTRELLKKDVASTKLSEVSFMPPALINSLNPERLKNLIAYLVAGGNKDHPVYKAQ
ncbi:MAG: c-type cytochrome [Agriterribacter sp.]